MGRKEMKLDYDAKDDVLYFHFRDGPAQSVKEVEDNVMVELDDDGNPFAVCRACYDAYVDNAGR